MNQSQIEKLKEGDRILWRPTGHTYIVSGISNVKIYGTSVNPLVDPRIKHIALSKAEALFSCYQVEKDGSQIS